MEHETTVTKRVASETSNDTKQVSSQEKPALNTTYAPKSKATHLKYNILLLFACQNCLIGVVHTSKLRVQATISHVNTHCNLLPVKARTSSVKINYHPGVQPSLVDNDG